MTLDELIKAIEAKRPSRDVKKLIQIAIMQAEFINVIGKK